MSTLEKAKERLRLEPKDYEYNEAKGLLIALGYAENNKGKTSGSRVRFYRENDQAIIDLHKPHPKSTLKSYAVRDLKKSLSEYGDL